MALTLIEGPNWPKPRYRAASLRPSPRNSGVLERLPSCRFPRTPTPTTGIRPARCELPRHRRELFRVHGVINP
jgi:hypothetical protein